MNVWIHPDQWEQLHLYNAGDSGKDAFCVGITVKRDASVVRHLPIQEYPTAQRAPKGVHTHIPHLCGHCPWWCQYLLRGACAVS